MFRMNLPCRPAGVFRGPMVVSMRPIPAPLVPRAVTVTAHYPMAHGAPVHVGDPARIGVRDVMKPDWGEPPTLLAGEAPLLGLRCDAAGRGAPGQAAARHHARARAHVRHGPPGLHARAL